MAMISQFRCAGCGFEFLPAGDAGFYVATHGDHRVAIGVDPSPGIVEKHTGLGYWDAWHKGLIGQVSSCICMECGKQFSLDLEREVKRCPGCSGLQVRSLQGATGCRCPRCEKGVIVSQPLAVS